MLGFRTSASRGAASRAEAANLRLASDAGARRAEHCRAPAFLPCSVFAPAHHAAPRHALRLQTFAWLRTQALAVRSTAEHYVLAMLGFRTSASRGAASRAEAANLRLAARHGG